MNPVLRRIAIGLGVALLAVGSMVVLRAAFPPPEYDLSPRHVDTRGSAYEGAAAAFSRFAQEAAAIERLGSVEAARTQTVRWGPEERVEIGPRWTGQYQHLRRLNHYVSGHYLYLGDCPVGGIWKQPEGTWYWYVADTAFGTDYRREYAESEDHARRACIEYLSGQLGRGGLPVR